MNRTYALVGDEQRYLQLSILPPICSVDAADISLGYESREPGP